MGTIISKLSKRSPRHLAGLGKVKVDKKPKPVDDTLVNVTASIFFDGTGNNRTNTKIGQEARLANTKAKYAVVAGHTVKLKASYASYYSNVAIMDYTNLISDRSRQVSHYVEGIGTQDGLDDDNLGSGFGAGATGVPAKVTKGIMELTKLIRKLFENDENKRLGHLTVNICGFSRGAAAARHFVARRTSEFFPHYSSLSGSLGVAPDTITINFVALFDTVSSYGGEKYQTVFGQIRNKLLHKSFDDDVEELHLAIGAHAKQVVQLAAADEYRKNFASTNIQSSVRAGVGLEVRLPGVHSDIGGSYEEHKEERRWVTAPEVDRLVAEGWYLRGKLRPQGGWWLEGVRALTHVYQFIPLDIMVTLATQGGMQFKPFTGANAAYAVPAQLQELGQLMKAYVLGRPGPVHLAPYEPATYILPTQFHWVRNQYLHRSAIQGEGSLDDISMAGRYEHKLPSRQVFPDFSPSR